MPFLRKIMDRLRHSPVFGTLAASALVLGLGFFNSIQLSRWLGPSGRGELAACFLYPTLLMYVFSVGQQPAILYYRSSGTEASRLVSTALCLSFFQTIAAIATGYFALPFLLGGNAHTLLADARFYLFAIALNLPSLSLVGIIQASQRFRLYNLTRMIVPSGYVVGAFVLHWVGKLTVHNVLILMLAMSGAVLVLAAILVRMVTGASLQRADWGLAKSLLGFGAKVQLGDLSQTVNLRLDQALLAAWFPAKELGLYTAAVSVSGLMDVLSAGYRMVVAPKVAAEVTPQGRTRIAQAYLRRYFGFSIAALVGLIVITPFAVPLVFSKAFSASIGPAQVLLVAGFFLGGKGLFAAIAQAMGRPMLSTRAELISLPITAITLPYLLPRFGIMGAAFASLFCYATQFIVLLYGLRRTQAISVRQIIPTRSETLVSGRV